MIQSNWFLLLPFLYGLSAALAGWIALAVRSRLDRPLVRAFSRLLWVECAWTLMLLFETLSIGYRGKVFWDNLQYPVSLAAAALFVLFAREATDFPLRIHRLLPALFAPALVSAILAFTDPLHGLIRHEPWLDASLPFGELRYGYTLFDYILFAYVYLWVGFAIFILVRSLVRAAPYDRSRYAMVLAAFMLPIFGVLLQILDVNLFGVRDISPFWFILGNPLLLAALYRYKLFDIVPIARRLVVDSFTDPILTYNRDGLLLDCNRAFAALFGFRPSQLRGRQLGDILRHWPDLQACLIMTGSCADGSEECGLRDPGTGASYRVTISPVFDTGAAATEVVCCTSVFRDVSRLEAVEKELLAWNTELETRITARLADLEQEAVRRRAAEEELRKTASRIVKSQKEILITLSEVMENRSPETANHVLRVGQYARILAEAYGLPGAEVDLITDAATLHDVGKIAVPDAILHKPGLLDEAEMGIMKKHSMVGYHILSSSQRSLIKTAATIALDHHERWNGLGYPLGKAGEAISLVGRIVCLCDVFDALATSRTYKKPWPFDSILEYISSEAGNIFDPAVVGLMLSNVDRFRTVSAKYPEISLLDDVPPMPINSREVQL
ncbi:MAG: HD domain-containing protein [Spirochaetes bacterium]|nr:HD domain-containing protein [Spirochaetota bacterium]MBU0956257.1 HD domain-containing protein [Spirochaetota bacterium]